ncbi:amidohydrolase [Auraticoccus cholistanensis]|uniref:amidohydrolase n=1 Tax=Auraticoccus cholistanensis TaxID=2656650 RepID=UPI0018D2284B
MPQPYDPVASPFRPLLLRGVRRVAVSGRRDEEPVDVRLADGRVAEVGRRLAAAGAEVVDAGGSWALPGLWDQHVHLGQWGMTFSRLDTAGAARPSDVLDQVAARVRELDAAGAPRQQVVTGFGHRTGAWWEPARVDELDRVSGGHPVVLISGDVHSCWMSSAALSLLGLPPRTGPLEELEWFQVQPRLLQLPGAAEQNEAGVAQAVRAAAARGVVGVTDFEFAANHRLWPRRLASAALPLRVRAGVYPELLEEVVALGLRTGSPLAPEHDPAGLLRMGPLKIISDGSLNTRTAWCCEPYATSSAQLAGQPTTGTVNYPAEQLADLLRRATAAGLEVAVHAIGDAAVGAAADVFAATGARGSVEHVQLARVEDLARLASLGVRASVQPVHLLDDRDVTELNWPGRADRCFMFRTMLDLGVELRFGSDAPVAPLDPWQAMAAAVHRSGDDREPWHAEQAVTAAEALAASTDGVPALVPGAPADVVLVDRDPLAEQPGSAAVAAHLRSVQVLATVVAGRRTV